MHQIIIVGGGVAGLEIASTLGRHFARDKRSKGLFDVLLLDADSAHVWKPMLHAIAAGTSDVSQQQTPYAAQAREAHFRYQPGEIGGLDRSTKEVIVAEMRSADGRLLVPARRMRYDTLILAMGSQANDFGTPGVSDRCMKIDSRREANHFNQEIRTRLLQAVALDKSLMIGIVGGGATGVQLAAELVQLAETASNYGAEKLKTLVSITLIESGSRLLAGFPEDISSATKNKLEALGIRVLLDSRVAEAAEGGFLLKDGRHVAVDLQVWAAGVKGPEVANLLDGLAVTPSHQIEIRPSLQTLADDSIYAVGDCSSLKASNADAPLPPTAQVAHQQASHLAQHLPRALSGQRPVPDFVFHDRGSLVSLGDYAAYGALGKFGLFNGITIRGRLAQYGHDMLYRSHQANLHGFWRGTLLWLVDLLNSRLKAPIRLD